MGITLRELLEKQRAEREAKEKGGDALAGYNTVSPTHTAPQPVVSPTPTPAVSSPKRSLFSNLSGAKNENQSTQTLGPQAANGTAGKQATPEAVASNSTANHNTASPTNITTSAGLAPAPIGPTLTADETENLRKNLAFLAANMDEREILGQVLRTTVDQIRQHPELAAIMIDSDYDLIVAAARKSMKYAVRKKEEKVDKRTAKKDQTAELKEFLKDSGISLDF